MTTKPKPRLTRSDLIYLAVAVAWSAFWLWLILDTLRSRYEPLPEVIVLSALCLFPLYVFAVGYRQWKGRGG